MRILALLLTFFTSVAHTAEVIPIEPIEKCFLCSSDPSLTMYWQGQGSKAVLMLIPGGEGHVGLKPGQTDNKFHQFQTLKRLTDPSLTSGQFDVVLLDPPYDADPREVARAIAAAAERLAPDGIVVLERSSRRDPELPQSVRRTRDVISGDSVLTFLVRR